LLPETQFVAENGKQSYRFWQQFVGCCRFRQQSCLVWTGHKGGSGAMHWSNRNDENRAEAPVSQPALHCSASLKLDSYSQQHT